jgi:hypothetical protein
VALVCKRLKADREQVQQTSPPCVHLVLNAEPLDLLMDAELLLDLSRQGLDRRTLSSAWKGQGSRPCGDTRLVGCRMACMPAELTADMLMQATTSARAGHEIVSRLEMEGEGTQGGKVTGSPCLHTERGIDTAPVRAGAAQTCRPPTTPHWHSWTQSI